MRARLMPAALAVLSAMGAVQAQTFRPIPATSTPVYGAGFRLVSPPSEGWFLAVDRESEALAFAKQDAQRGTRRGSVMVIAARVRAQAAFIGTPQALRAELDRSVRASSARHVLLSLNLEPYADGELGTDCVNIASASEDHRAGRSGEVLAMHIVGKACRQPSSASHYVQVTCSERRPSGDPPLMDETMRRECQGIIDSLRFGAAP